MYSEIEKNITDLSSGVEYLKEVFEHMRWDASHEAVYGRNQFYSEDQCKNFEKKFAKAAILCAAFLEDIVDIRKFVDVVISLKFEYYLECIREYIPFKLPLNEDETESYLSHTNDG